MIVLSTSSEQTLAVGEALIFDTEIYHGGRAEYHRANTAGVKLCAQCGKYAVSFHGNVSGATAGTQLSLSIDASGSRLPETTMLSTPATENTFNNVGASTRYANCACGYDTLTVVNTGTTEVVVAAGACFTINRVA